MVCSWSAAEFGMGFSRPEIEGESGEVVHLAVSAQLGLSLHYLYLFHLFRHQCIDCGASQSSTTINICKEHKRDWVSSRKSMHGIKQDHAPPLPSYP